MKNSINSSIKKIRIIRGLTRPEVANHLCISDRQYANIENGISKIDVERLISISKILNVKIETIINFDEVSFLR